MSWSTELPITVGIDLRLASYRLGGIARYGSQLCEALKARPDLTMVGLRSRIDRAARDVDRKLVTPPHHRLEHLMLPLELAARRIDLDVYHAIDVVAPRLRSTHVVATVHDLAFRRWPEDLASDALAYYRRLESSRRWTDAWIVPSEWTATDLAEMYAVERERIHVIPHGDSLSLRGDAVIGREGRTNAILAVGTVEPRKRYDLLLDAMRDVGQVVTLIVVGTPGWKSDETQQRLRDTAGVTWRDAVDDVTLRTLYRTSLAVVVPSRAEGFGLAALEAMAAGTPVISSGGGALTEVTGSASLDVGDADPEAWAAAIREVHEDRELWNEMSASGRRRSEFFSWMKAAEATAGVYLARSGG